MKRIILFCLLIIGFANWAQAQGKYWVFFTDKDGISFNPYEYFDEKAIERRLKNNVDLYDKSDFPVKKEYLEKVNSIAGSTSHHTRWFNAVAVYAGSQQIRTIKSLDFVRKVSQFPEKQMEYTGINDYDTTLSFEHSEMLENQTAIMGRSELKKHDINGEGVRIAVFDGGFPGVDEIPVLKHLREDGRILRTYDFTDDEKDAYCGISHGTIVLSCIAGKIGDKQLGLATGAEFMLARTEIRTEPFSEEENWLAAMEWADKHGAQIINSSLGYTHHRYYPEEMDGDHSLVAEAANMAAAKGMLVVNAAGNRGNDESWTVIGTPADADSVLAVAGVKPKTGYHIGFSSFGPTKDKRMKPNISAFGKVVAAGEDGLKRTFGTSFASPLACGFAACALQAKPELKTMELFHEVEKAGHLYPYFDYAHGYGIPKAKAIFDEERNPGKTFDFIEENGKVKVEVKEEIFEDEQYDTRFLLYYNIQKPSGVLDEYYVLSVNKTDVFEIDKSDISEGYKLNVHYTGYTGTYEFQ